MITGLLHCQSVSHNHQTKRITDLSKTTRPDYHLVSSISTPILLSRLDHLMLVLVTSWQMEKQESSYYQFILVVENLQLPTLQELLHLYPMLVLVNSLPSLEQQNPQQYSVNLRVCLLFKVVRTRHLYLQLMLLLVNSLPSLVLESFVLLSSNPNQYYSSSMEVQSRNIPRTTLVVVLYMQLSVRLMLMQPLMTRELHSLTTHHPELPSQVKIMDSFVKMQRILTIVMSSSTIRMNSSAPMLMK